MHLTELISTINRKLKKIRVLDFIISEALTLKNTSQRDLNKRGSIYSPFILFSDIEYIKLINVQKCNTKISFHTIEMCKSKKRQERYIAAFYCSCENKDPDKSKPS